MRISIRMILGFVLAIALSGCVPVPGTNSAGSGGQTPGYINENACGNIRFNEAGRKIHTFLAATAELDRQTLSTMAEIRTACLVMGRELSMTINDEGETGVICAAVIKELDRQQSMAVQTRSELRAHYKPAECRINVDLAADIRAECSGEANVEANLSCRGACRGSCFGRCDGQCSATNAQGECASVCAGTCYGKCDGYCDANTSVQADAACNASADVRANLSAVCEPAEFEMRYTQDVVVDEIAMRRVDAAVDVGMARILSMRARIEGPLSRAFTIWARSLPGVVEAGWDAAQSFGAATFCVMGQLNAAAQAMTRIEANISVSIEVSVEASAAVGATSN